MPSRTFLFFVVSFALSALPGDPLNAADICKAVATKDVPAVEAPDYILRKGEEDTAITQYRVSKKTGRATFCSHGGYCYPSEGLRLLNCKVGAKTNFSDADDT